VELFRQADYTLLIRTRIKGLVIKTMRTRAEKWIGESVLDGLQMIAMKTALNQDLVELSKRGYISRSSVVISTTDAEQRIGHATLDLTFMPVRLGPSLPPGALPPWKSAAARACPKPANP
jgi:hypothetical protein